MCPWKLPLFCPGTTGTLPPSLLYLLARQIITSQTISARERQRLQTMSLIKKLNTIGLLSGLKFILGTWLVRISLRLRLAHQWTPLASLIIVNGAQRIVRPH